MKDSVIPVSSNQHSPPRGASATYEIVFDGGALGNPGKGYGSYIVSHGGADIQRIRHEYGDNVTNNQAEYQTLIEALAWLASKLGSTASKTSVHVNGDSQLVLNQLMGRWKVKNQGLRPLHHKASGLIRQFRDVSLVWHSRDHSMKRLGH
ncbi:hypothetical protein BH24CHL3_BH24CHL3_06200 [soil metagenome]